MSECTLVYNIPAWSKDIDLFANCDKQNTMLDHLLPGDGALYNARRMSDDALSAQTTTTATSGPASPATEPDAVPAPSVPAAAAAATLAARKPSLPGIGALTPLLDPADADPFPRRASLPTLASDLSLRSPTLRVSARHDPALATYAFPSAEADRTRLDDSFCTSSTSSSFPSPFTSPLSPAPYSQQQQQQQQQQYARWPEHQQQQQQQWSPDAHSPSAPSSPKRRRSPPAAAAPPPQSDSAPPQRRRGKLPKHTTDLLKEWLHAHSDHPYPSEDEKRDLCARTKLSMSQVSNWMINARRRILAPAKNPSHAATTSEPYRSRPIGALYPPTHHLPHSHHQFSAPTAPPALRLYDPAAPAPPFPSYPFQDSRRLAYPASTLDSPYPPPYPSHHHHHPHSHHMFMQGPGPAARAEAPRYFAAAPDV